MRLLPAVLLLLPVLLAQACSGGLTAEGKLRWNSAQTQLSAADAAIRAKDFDSAAEIYEHLWRDADVAAPPDGTYYRWLVAGNLRQFVACWPTAADQFGALMPPLVQRFESGCWTEDDFRAGECLADALRDDKHYIAMAEVAIRQRRVMDRIRSDESVQSTFVYFLARAGRNDLAEPIRPTPCEQAFRGVGHGTANVASLPFTILFGRGIAPK